MMEFIKNSAFFGAMISLIAYEIGLILKKKFKMAIFNPLLISIICVIGVLLLFHIDYDDYNEGGKYISYLLTPATVCLALIIRNMSLCSRSLSQPPSEWAFPRSLAVS